MDINFEVFEKDGSSIALFDNHKIAVNFARRESIRRTDYIRMANTHSEAEIIFINGEITSDSGGYAAFIEIEEQPPSVVVVAGEEPPVTNYSIFDADDTKIAVIDYCVGAVNFANRESLRLQSTFTMKSQSTGWKIVFNRGIVGFDDGNFASLVEIPTPAPADVPLIPIAPQPTVLRLPHPDHVDFITAGFEVRDVNAVLICNTLKYKHAAMIAQKSSLECECIITVRDIANVRIVAEWEAGNMTFCETAQNAYTPTDTKTMFVPFVVYKRQHEEIYRARFDKRFYTTLPELEEAHTKLNASIVDDNYQAHIVSFRHITIKGNYSHWV